MQQKETTEKEECIIDATLNCIGRENGNYIREYVVAICLCDDPNFDVQRSIALWEKLDGKSLEEREAILMEEV